VDKVCQHISLLETDYFSLTFRDGTASKVSQQIIDVVFLHCTGWAKTPAHFQCTVSMQPFKTFTPTCSENSWD